MFNNQNPVRPVGVTTNTQPDDRAPMKTLVEAVPVQHVLVVYGDDNGRKVTSVALKIGDTYFMHPDAERWSRECRPVNKWLAEQIDDKLAAQSDGGIPKKDAVDIL